MLLSDTEKIYAFQTSVSFSHWQIPLFGTLFEINKYKVHKQKKQENALQNICATMKVMDYIRKKSTTCFIDILFNVNQNIPLM